MFYFCFLKVVQKAAYFNYDKAFLQTPFFMHILLLSGSYLNKRGIVPMANEILVGQLTHFRAYIRCMLYLEHWFQPFLKVDK